MARFIQQEVSAIRDNPHEDESVELVLGVEKGTSENVEQRVKDLNGEVVEELPFSSLLVEMPENKVDSICTTPGIESVELDTGMEVLAGN